MNRSPFRTLAACALGTLIGTATSSMADVMLADWTDDEHFYYYINHMPDFDQKRCEDMEPSVEGLPNDGRNHCAPTATANVLSYIASHGFPHIAPGVVYNPESNAHYNYFSEFIEELGNDMDTDPGWEPDTGGTNYNDYYNEIRSRLSCEFVVKLYIADEEYSPNFKGLCRSAINGHLVLVRYGYYEDEGQTSGGRYKVDREGGHLTTFSQGWGWEGTEILTVRDPATGGSSDECHDQSDFSSRSWHVEERNVRVDGDNRVQCYLWEPDSTDNDYGDSRRYLDGYISIIPNRFYSWGPHDNGLQLYAPNDWIFTNLEAGPVAASSVFDNWKIAEFHPRPTGLGGWALMKSPKGQTRMAEINLDTNTLEPMTLSNIADSPMRFTPDAHDRVWLVDGAPGQQTRLHLIDFPTGASEIGDLGFRALASMDLQSPPATMIADRDGGICAFSPTERVVRWYSAAGPDSQIELVGTASLPQQIAFQGECKMDIDPKTGNLAFWSEGIPNKIWSLALDEEGVFEVSEIHGDEDQPIHGFQFDDQGDLLVAIEGTLQAFTRTEQGQWVPSADHLFNNVSMYDHIAGDTPGTDPSMSRFRMLRSSNNLPSELPAKEYDNAGVQYESSQSANEVVDCDADINRDQNVDVSDMLMVIAEWGKEHSPADIAHDGTVDVLDLLAIFETWGSCR
ncbi:MAG: hypothetical protein P8K80_01005 [Phycisphaerales bacterium]|nr:hypothetical protein [Phycisphaerales bacterium]